MTFVLSNRRVAPALLALLAAAISGAADRTHDPDGAASVPASWSEAELRAVRSLWIGNLGEPPADPSNRVADDPAAAELGHRLFFDPRLSRTGQVSCATCHQPYRLFTDGLPRARALGVTRRGTPTLLGAAYSPWFYWDGRRDSPWAQALAPLEALPEMAGTRVSQVRLVAGDATYREAYTALFGPLPDLRDTERFPERAGPVGTSRDREAWSAMTDEDRRSVNRAFSNLGKAIAAYERKLIPGPSRFDRYVEKLPEESPILDADERAGLRLFIGPDSQCMRCHNGPLFTNHGFHNIGVPEAPGAPPDLGRIEAVPEVLRHEFNCLSEYSDATEEQCPELRFVKAEGVELPGAFKVPTLRNVSRTAPYLHNGRLRTLREVLEHYSRPRSTVGHLELTPMRFSDDELRQLEAFLRTLESPVDAEAHWLAPHAPAAKAGRPGQRTSQSSTTTLK